MKKILWKRMKRSRKNAQIAKIICTLIRICLITYIIIAFLLMFVDAFVILMSRSISMMLCLTATAACFLYAVFVVVEGVYIKKYKLSKKEFMSYNN